MIKHLFLLSTLLLVACAAPMKQRHVTAQLDNITPDELLANDLLADASESSPLSIQDFLALPTEYRQQLDAHVLIHENETDRFDALLTWAFEGVESDFKYDPTVTSPLSELSESDRINCFSFSNLLVAAARYADIDASFQLVDSPPQWDMEEDTWLITQHINVTGEVQKDITDRDGAVVRFNSPETGSRILTRQSATGRNTFTADLNPEIATDFYRTRQITDVQALSLFYSNRSVEKLVRGDNDEALKLGLMAIKVDENSGVAWNNLGVLFSRAGRYEEARDSYLTALNLDPTSASSANNLERVYRRLGEDEKADAMARTIANYRMKNPYYHYAMGATKLEYGYLDDALEHFEDAINRKNDERLFYYRLAETQMKLGKYRRATRSLETAKEYSNSADMWRYDQLALDLQTALNGG